MKLDSRLHPVFVTAVFMAVCLLPAMALKDISPSNELRYLSIADEAIENGSVFTFSNQGEPYADKPPLYLWLLMLSKLLFGGHNTFILSLFSFIPAIVTIAVMDRWLMQVSRLTSIKFPFGDRFAAAMALGTSAMFLGTAVILRMDMLMTMFIVLALYTFYKMYRGIGNSTANGILLPVYIFLALFTKGPVGILMPVLSIFFFLLLSGRLKDTGRYLGVRTWLILALLCGAWFLGVWLEGGREYLDNLLFHQTLDRAVDAFHHKKPVWYYLVAIWYVAAPYSIAAIYALFSRAGRQGYVTDAGRLFVVSFAVTFIMLSLFSSKLSVYLLPVLPFLIYYMALSGRNTGCNGWMRFAFMVPALLLAIVAVAMFSAPHVMAFIPGLSLPEDMLQTARSGYVYVAGALLLVCSVLSMHALFRRKSWTEAASWLSASILLVVLSLTPLVPRLNDYIGYRNLAAVAKELKEISGASGVATYGVHRPENMDVFLGEDVLILDGTESGEAVSGLSDMILIAGKPALRDDQAAAETLSGMYNVQVGDYLVYVIRRMPDL